MRTRASWLPALAALLLLAACGHDGHALSATDSGGPPPAVDHAAMGHVMPMDDGDGLSATKAGYTLTAVRGPAKAGKAGRLSFRVDSPAGTVQKEFARAQTKLMHVYVVRTDLTGYQHVHPTMDPATGTWSVDLTIPEPGRYRVLTEFIALRPDHADTDALKLGAPFTVPGRYDPVPYEAATGPRTVDGYRVVLDGTPAVHGGAPLTLRISRGGTDVTDLQPYLESYAHVTGFRTGDLKAVHVHPNEKPTGADALGGPALTLAPMFTAAGTYRLFVEFRAGGVVHTVPVDVEVAG
jgi:hypothetical protein